MKSLIFVLILALEIHSANAQSNSFIVNIPKIGVLADFEITKVSSTYISTSKKIWCSGTAIGIPPATIFDLTPDYKDPDKITFSSEGDFLQAFVFKESGSCIYRPLSLQMELKKKNSEMTLNFWFRAGSNRDARQGLICRPIGSDILRYDCTPSGYGTVIEFQLDQDYKMIVDKQRIDPTKIIIEPQNGR